MGKDARATAALAAAADADTDSAVKAAAKAAQAGTPPLPARDKWVTFYVVEPTADDAPVRQEPYFVQTPDGLVWATYTDGRGFLTSEHVPAGDADTWPIEPASREAEF
jgi:hypothetical protein